MITAGIDMGARAIKAVVLSDGAVIGRGMGVAGFDVGTAATEVLASALAQAGAARVQRIVATGVGREGAPDRDATVTEVGCAARAAHALFPEARTVIDVGAEQARAIRIDERGRVVDFAINDKCAAGAGAFAEAVARALEVPVEGLGPLSLKSTRAISMNAQCAVFAESEVVSLIHNNVPKADVASAVHDAIASRIVSMVRSVGSRPPVVLIGGMARNAGFVDALGRGLEGSAILIPDHVEYCGALGAALAAVD